MNIESFFNNAVVSLSNKLELDSAHIAQQVEKNLIKRILQACIIEQLLPYVIEDGVLFIFLKQSNRAIKIKDYEIFLLGKLKIDSDLLLVQNGQTIVIETVSFLLNLIYDELFQIVDLNLWMAFSQEIENCLANDLLTTKFHYQFNNMLNNDITKLSCHSLIEYVSTNFSTAGKLLFFEAWATRGHPYHPCHKTKLGFNQEDCLRYSPEFFQDINLMIVAVKKSIMHIEEEHDYLNYNSWFAMQFPLQWDHFCKNLDLYGLSNTEYLPIFVHPWQYENVLINLMCHYFKNKQLILFKDTVITTKASLSFRTLIVKHNSRQPHIKVPVGVQSTSALRVNSPSSVENGPRISKILREILINENYFDQTLRVAYESYGLHLNHPDKDIAKHFGIIYRENPTNLISKNQMPIVVAALYEKSSLNDCSLFIEILQAAACYTLTAALDYFDQYCQIVMNGFLDLFLIYGIALEGHQQNTIVAFENYQPVFMIARDLSGLRIHENTLEKKGFNFKCYPNSEIITEDSAEVTNKFLHTVIQYHLGEIALLLSQYYGISEKIFWKIIKNNIEIRFQKLKNVIDSKRWQQIYRAILQDDWQFKSLLRMRLKNLSKKYIYITVKNPFRDI